MNKLFKIFLAQHFKIQSKLQEWKFINIISLNARVVSDHVRVYQINCYKHMNSYSLYIAYHSEFPTIYIPNVNSMASTMSRKNIHTQTLPNFSYLYSLYEYQQDSRIAGQYNSRNTCEQKYRLQLLLRFFCENTKVLCVILLLQEIAQQQVTQRSVNLQLLTRVSEYCTYLCLRQMSWLGQFGYVLVFFFVRIDLEFV